MPKEIKTTIAVDGEAAFKKAINDATTSIRNMGTQLTLAQAQFKKDGDAMKLVETRSKALKGEIGQQEEIVKALEKAVNDSSKAYGENSDKTEKWQAELNRAKAKLANLQSELTLNEQGLDRNGKAFDEGAQHAADYQATLQGIGKNVSFETITNGINGITGLITGAIDKIIDLGKRITETMREAAQWADDLITEAIINGLSVEDQQRMEYASKFADTSVDTIMKARDKLVTKMVKGWKDGKVDMWQFLGIDASTTRDPMDVLFDLGTTLQNVAWADKNDTRADAWAMEVFGKSYRELLPLFNYGKEAFYAKMGEAPIVSDEDVQKLGSLNDKFDEFDSRLEQLKNTTLAQLAPAMEDIVDVINTMLASFSEWVSTEEGKQAMDDLAESIKELFSGLKDVSFKDVIEKVKDAINGIKDALKWLGDHKDDVVTGLEVIAGGFAALKVTQLAMDIGKIVSGFETLWAGANKPLPTVPGSETQTGTPTPVPTGTSSGTGKNMPANAALLADGVTMFDTKLGQAGAVGFLYQMESMLREEFNEKMQELEQLTEENQWDETARNYWMLTGKHPDLNSGEYKEWEEAFRGETPKAETKTREQQTQEFLENAIAAATVEKLLADIGKYGGEFDNINGWRPGSMLKRFLGIYEDEWGNPYNEPLNQSDLEGLAGYLHDLEEKKAEANPILGMDPEDFEEVLMGYSDKDKYNAVQDWWDSHLNVLHGREDQAEEDSAFAYMMEVFGDEFGDVFFAITEKLNELNGSQTPEDIPEEWWKTGGTSGSLSALDDAVAEMKVNTNATKTASDKIASADFKKFNSLPGEITKAAQSGTAAGVSGIQVRLDGSTVGRLVAPYVSSYIAMGAQ